jgi:hypothetical protein
VDTTEIDICSECALCSTKYAQTGNLLSYSLCRLCASKKNYVDYLDMHILF